MKQLAHLNLLMEQYFRFVKKLLPGEKGVSKVGFDLTNDSCKYVALTQTGESYEIQSWGIRSFEPGNATEALKHLLHNPDLVSKSPVTSLSGKGTLIRYVDMPRMSIVDLKKSFSLEVDKYFPFDKDSIYTDCCILDPKSKDKKMAVLIAAVKKEMVDDRVKTLTSAGFEVQQMTINAIAVANAFQKLKGGASASHESEKSAKAILDIGGTVSNLMILKDRVPRFTRDIFIGSQEVTKRISNTLGISPDEAERLKMEPGDQLENIYNICESTIANWVSEIRLSLDYFITEKNIQVDELLLTGGGSMLVGIETMFEKNLDLKVRTWDILTGVNLAPSLDKETIKKQSPRLAVAMGLALSQYD
ncbi:MAG: type IV pilus assembly protein PilM [Candidatus Omnitrophica bacterium]|nr:type IV pilus assembly protein PilM [Candidatus Omnitrophota bacterium]